MKFRTRFAPLLLALALPVFAQNGVDFSWEHRERYPIVCHYGWVSLGNTRQLQSWHS